MEAIQAERADAKSISPGGKARQSPGIGSAVVLLLVYFVLSLFVGTHAFLGPDEGGKVATLRSMDARHTLVPDVGYWAHADDPNAAYHPLYDTAVVDGHYVQVTTVPFVLLAEPLWRLGGYRAIVLLAMLGGVACAFAAAALARRLGSDDDRLIFWVIGLASPVLLYALDFWEHTTGLALMVFGVVLFIDALDSLGSRRGLVRALGAGALFGAAASMRS